MDRWIDRARRWGRRTGVVRAHERKPAHGERFRVRGGRDLVEDRRLGLDRRPGVVRHGRAHLREHGNVVGLRAVEVGRGWSASGGWVLERSNSNEKENKSRGWTAGTTTRPAARTLSNRRSRSRGRALARQSPWNCSTRLTRCGASTSSAVSAEMSREASRALVVEDHRRLVFAAVASLASLAPGVDTFPGRTCRRNSRGDPERVAAAVGSSPATRAGVCRVSGAHLHATSAAR